MYITEMNPVAKAKAKANSKTMCHHLNFSIKVNKLEFKSEFEFD